MMRSLAVQHAPPPNPQVLGSWVRRMKLDPLLDHARQHARHLPACTRQALEDLHPRRHTDNIPLAQYLGFFAATARALNDPCLGLRIGLGHQSPALSPLQNLFFNGAPSLHDALVELNHSATALQNNLRTGMQIEASRARVFYQPAASQGPALHDIEYSLGLLIHAMRSRLGAHWAPQELHLAHTLSGCGQALIAGLLRGTRILDQADMNAIVFPAQLLQKTRPGIINDDQVLIFFRQYLNDLCVEHSGGSMREKVRLLIEHALRDTPPGALVAPSLEWAASHLNLSARSLQRKLAAEQASFSSLLEEVRHQLVLEWMRHRHLNMGEMAEKLGYADHATFCNAFKRWTGMPPSRYRSATTH